MKRAAFILLATLTVTTGTIVLIWQQGHINTFRNQQTALQRRVNDLQKQYASIQAAGVIDTSSWKQFCDPQVNFCFKYPATWKFEGGQSNEFGYLTASITNPEETVRINYIEPLVKDGSSYSTHIVSVNPKDLNETKLEIIGSYPVSSGVYAPGYTILNERLAQYSVAGRVGFGVVNPRFDVGTHDAIALNGSYIGPKMTSSAQAEAWFKSIEGKTVQAILDSYGT